ncbi:MAG: PVC-type heme-binding CxxCH protein, partial [Limisphaerales bacterium]
MSLLFAFSLQAQNGDRKDAAGEKQIAPIPPEKIPPAPVLSAEQALKSFKIASGFRVEIVAAEPLVHDPVAMTFGPDGRIWVVEMSGYMRDPEAQGEDQPFGKIVVLEDTDGDGKMDKRIVFTENLVMPRALCLVRDGLLVAEPPHLWFLRDTDGDGKADDKTEVAKDYGNQRSPEHTANGLLWALDNWIYSADHTARFRSLEEGWKREPTAFRGQWGIAEDDFGRLVYNSNSDQYRMDLVPSSYLNRNPNFRNPIGLNVDPIKNQTTWPIRVTPGVNRGYRAGTLRRDGTLISFTAACAPLIYRGDNFPKEFYGNAFVCEPSANLIKRNILVETNGNITGFQAYTNAEFLASTDERFRPVNLNNGPDGALYIVDMYHGILQHRIFLTSYLRAQSEARGLEKPIGLGRIYRVVADGTKTKKVSLAKKSSAQLVKNLSDPNGWARDTAQRLLVERAESASIPELRKLATTGTEPLGRLHALWTLEGIGQLDQPTLLKAFSDSHPKVKAAAIRLSEFLLKTGAKDQVLIGLLKLVNDPAPDVQLQLAFTFGEVVDPKAEM